MLLGVRPRRATLELTTVHNQGLQARPGASRRRVWLVGAAATVDGVPMVDDELVRAEVGYAGAAALMGAPLRRLYRA